MGKEGESWRLGVMSGISIGLSAAAVAFNLFAVFAKHGSVGEDGVGAAGAAESGGRGELRACAGQDGAGAAAPCGVAEGVLESGAAEPDLADGEGDRAGVGDDDGREAERRRRFIYGTLGRLPIYLMLDRACCGAGTALGCYDIAANIEQVYDRDDQGGRGKDKREDFVRVHGGDYTKNHTQQTKERKER